MRPARFSLVTAAVLSLAAAAWGDVRLHGLFSDNAVVQQNAAVPIWGTARDGETVTVELAGQKASTVAAAGKWRVTLKDLPAGGPHTLTVQGDNAVTARNILIGEVWLCSGQSNMGRTLVPPDSVQPRLPAWDEAAARADDPQIRHFRVGGGALDAPTGDVIGQWELCTPAAARNFTAVGYFFARDLRKARGVPVGLINASVGATGAASWTSTAALQSHPELQKILDRHQKARAAYPEQLARYKADEPKLQADYEAAVARARAEKTPEPRKPTPPNDPFKDAYRPAGLYNGKIAPLQPYAMRGVLWYQGENNSGHAREYGVLFPALIRDWRSRWAQGDFPFLFVQLPEYKKTPPDMRDVQLQIWRTMPNTAMVVTIDCGDADDIHPPNKEPVGQRLALAARGLVYGEQITWSGPLVDTLTIDGNKAVLRFTHVGQGLVLKGESGFELAGPDGRYQPAKAEIVGDTLVLSSETIATPAMVRYAWANVPTPTLYNRDGLPASPFQVSSIRK